MYSNIEFVIACGGLSTRNYPHSKGIAHKCLMPFGDIRLIDYVLNQITRMGGKHITLVCSDIETIDAFKKALSRDENTVEKLKKKNRTEIAEVLQSTFLPENTDLKFVIQDKPIGTAHVLYCASKVAQNRHICLIFPDDIMVSKDENNSFLKRLINDFIKDEHQILVTGIKKDDVSNNAILTNKRLIEKPKIPANHIAGFSPFVLPRELIQSLQKEWETNSEKILNLGHEWFYVDAINNFLDNGAETNGFYIKMFMINSTDTLLDTGALPLYEQAQLFALLKLSRFKEQNKEIAKKLIEANRK